MVVDTNILIACLSAEPNAVAAVSAWKQEGRVLFVSSVSLTETLSFNSLTDIEILRIKGFFTNFISIAVNDRIAEMAGFFRRTYRIETPDAIIAATAMVQKTSLVTRDRQFLKIKEISIVEI